MKTTFAYIAIVTLLLTLVIGMIYRGTRSSSLDAEQAANLFGKGMPPSLMTRAAHMDIDTEEISVMMELIQESMNPSSWIARGGCSRNVVVGDLIEVDEPEGEYTLSITLLWRDQEVATERRYFLFRSAGASYSVYFPPGNATTT